MKELLFFEPVFKTMIWGGNKMRDMFGYEIPGENTGECWAISAHQNGDCVLKNGEFAGKTLSWLWDNKKELFGNYDSDRFPLLLKVIDAKTDLSIQVHPDDEYAKEKENGSLGKTECWYILDCEENSSLVVGHNAKTKEELISMIDEKRFKELISEVPIKKGDFIQINPGTVHAIKGGVVILETQQNSDITYRVYDYDRLDNGKLRPLHLEKSKDVIKVPQSGKKIIHTSETESIEELISCKYYSLCKLNVKGEISLEFKDPFRIVSCIEGDGFAGELSIKKGDHFIIPNGFGKISFRGDMVLVSSAPA